MLVKLKTLMAGPNGVFEPNDELSDTGEHKTHDTKTLSDLIKGRFAYSLDREIAIVQPEETASLNPKIETAVKRGRPSVQRNTKT
jgi:hypothetical protein